MNIDFVITLLCIIPISILGLIILLRNPKMTTNRHFAFLAVSISVWTLFNMLSGGTSTNKLLVDLVFVGGIATAVSLFLLMSNFPKEQVVGKRTIKVFTVASVIMGLMVFHPQFVTEVTRDEIITGYLYNVYILYILVALGLVVLTIVRQIKASKTPESHRQAIILAWGVLLYAVLAVISNVIAPLLVNSWSTSRFGPVSALFFIGVIAYSIIKHKLFDIRSFVIRGVVYILTIGVVGLLYAVTVFAVGALFINTKNINNVQWVFFITLALVVAISYSPITSFFNKYTSKLFYRDAYDTQDVLDQIGKIIVGSIDLHKIQKNTLNVLLSALRPNYGGFILKDSLGRVRVQDFVGEAPRFELDELSQITGSVGKKILIYDDLSNINSELVLMLRKNDISLIAPLITKNETIGYYISGPKKSGNLYTTQDLKMLNIVTNELAVALQNAQRFEEIQAFNITLQEKVNEATRELKSTNRKLIELDEAKDEFISMASHQLRTPLTSIKGYLSMLLDGDMGKLGDNQTNALKEAFGSSQRMVFLISDFLNVSRIKTGKFVIEKSEVNLASMVQEELAQLKELAESRSVEFKYDQPKEFPAVMLDDNKIRQVMMNMIDNAIYYTPMGGTVTVQLYVDAKEVVFKVIDTGIGVPKAERHKLFTKFFRAANARVARPDGTGLGLFMAQKIVLAQGGVIIFESEEGKGSTFGWRFPLSKIKP